MKEHDPRLFPPEGAGACRDRPLCKAASGHDAEEGVIGNFVEPNTPCRCPNHPTYLGDAEVGSHAISGLAPSPHYDGYGKFQTLIEDRLECALVAPVSTAQAICHIRCG